MCNKIKRQRINLLMAVLIVGLTVVSGLIIWIVCNKNAFEIGQNIYFTEYDGNKHTIIFKYDPISDDVMEIGRVSGYLSECIINKEESKIIGLLREAYMEGSIDIVEYDIDTGIIVSKNAIEKIKELAMGASWKAMLYDEGNKILINYENGEKIRQLISYDFVTGKYESVAENLWVYDYLVIDDHSLWYLSVGGLVYCYDWEKHTDTQVMNSVYCAAMSADTGLVAYIEKDDTSQKEIYLTSVNRTRKSCIATKGWNIIYDNFDYVNATWSSDGRQFFYMKSFPIMFNGGDTSLMIYDVESGKHRCIYKVRATTHEFQYISNS